MLIFAVLNFLLWAFIVILGLAVLGWIGHSIVRFFNWWVDTSDEFPWYGQIIWLSLPFLPAAWLLGSFFWPYISPFLSVEGIKIIFFWGLVVFIPSTIVCGLGSLFNYVKDRIR